MIDEEVLELSMTHGSALYDLWKKLRLAHEIGHSYLQNMKAFLHYRQDCLFKPRPVFSFRNLGKWKVSAWSSGSPNGFLNEG